MPKGASHEKRSLVWSHHHGRRRAGGFCPAARAGANGQRSSGSVDAGTDRRRHHARFSDRLYPDGHGHDVRLDCLSKSEPVAGGAADAGPDGAACLFGHVQRCADFDSPVRLHGLSGGAGQPDRETVQEPAPGHRPHSGFAGSGHHRHLCCLCDGHRHCGCGGDADGLAGLSGHAQGRLRHQAVGRCHHRRRLSGHPDSALGAADCLWRYGWRVGSAALCRRLLPRHHAGRAVCGLRDCGGQAQAKPGATAVGRRPQGGTACVCSGNLENHQQQRSARTDRRHQGQA